MHIAGHDLHASTNSLVLHILVSNKLTLQVRKCKPVLVLFIPLTQRLKIHPISSGRLIQV